MQKDIREYLKEAVLLFDGAMGTCLSPDAAGPDLPCELANLTAPEAVAALHRAYLDAGARAVKTNTFRANRLVLGEGCARALRAGWQLAAECAGEDAFVFADIGPVDAPEAAEAAEEYRYIAGEFLDCGAHHFLFETNGSLRGLKEAAAYIKEREPEAFVLVSFAAQPDGFTREGYFYAEKLRSAAESPAIDAVGLNCVSGARHMAELISALHWDGRKPLSAMPNAGYPSVRGQRVYYDGDPAYFARQLRALRDAGARILGGCCGTTPEHIAAAAAALGEKSMARPRPRSAAPSAPPEKEPENPFWKKLCDSAQKPFAVELDSPTDTDMTKYLAGARELQDAGADIITIADCPIARAKMDSSLTACKLRRELGIDALPHMTCRDRNLNATQALLLGLCAEGVRNVLIVTGDPIPSAQRDEVKSVYNFNSRKLIRYIASLNSGAFSPPFHVFGALNVNARNFDIQLRLAMEKEKNGAEGFFTQPILTRRGLENLKAARGALRGKLLAGIIPVVSHRNAQFMNSEVSGIEVDERITAAYEGLDRAQGEALGVEISAAVAMAAAPWCDGYYLITPFSRTGLMANIIRRIREAEAGQPLAISEKWSIIFA